MLSMQSSSRTRSSVQSITLWNTTISQTDFIATACFMSRPTSMKSSIVLCYNINKLTYLLTASWRISRWTGCRPTFSVRMLYHDVYIDLYVMDGRPPFWKKPFNRYISLQPFHRFYYSALRWHSGNVMVGNITFLMIFAVFDLSPLTLWINCSF